MSRLTLSYAPEDEWHGELTANVTSEGFSGESAAWFGMEQLKAFNERLKAFPIPAGQEPSLGGGFWENDQLKEAHVSIHIEPAGSRGQLRVNVILAKPPWELNGPEKHSVAAHFLVNYADLGVFQAQFSALLNGDHTKAHLENVPS